MAMRVAIRSRDVPKGEQLVALQEALRRARRQRDRLESVEVTSGASYLEGAFRCAVLRVRLRLHRLRTGPQEPGRGDAEAEAAQPTV